MKLTSKQIENLAQREGAKKIAVENFLSSMGDNFEENVRNCKLDSKIYRWNAETFSSIIEGIRMLEELKLRFEKIARIIAILRVKGEKVNFDNVCITSLSIPGGTVSGDEYEKIFKEICERISKEENILF